MRNALEGFNGGVKFGGKKITNLRYADDTTLVCSSREELIDLLNRIKQASEEKDLLNTKKIKIMVVDRDNNTTDFTIAGNKIEVVNQFEYLGSIINNKGESTTEIRRRLAMARSTVQSMSHIWKSRGLSLSVWRFVCFMQLHSLLRHTEVSPGPWQRMTERELMPLKCGATGGCCMCHGKIKRQMCGFWTRLEQTWPSEGESWKEN